MSGLEFAHGSPSKFWAMRRLYYGYSVGGKPDWNRVSWIAGLASILVGFLCSGTAASKTRKTVTVEYRFFPGLANVDGKVYVGHACHGCSGHLVFYDSKADHMVDVGDLNTLTGENGSGVGPQSRIHAKVRGR
jgi:hypothetical protein